MHRAKISQCLSSFPMAHRVVLVHLLVSLICISFCVGNKIKIPLVELNLCQGYTGELATADVYNVDEEATLKIPAGTTANLNNEKLHFRLNGRSKAPLSCQDKSQVEQTVWLTNASVIPPLKFGYLNESQSAYLPVHFTRDGHFYNGTFYYKPNSFCVKSYSKTEVVLLLCPISISDPANVFVSKCCDLDEVLDFWSLECKKVNEGIHWNPYILNGNNLPINISYDESKRTRKSQKSLQFYRHHFESCDKRSHFYMRRTMADVENLEYNHTTKKDKISMILGNKVELVLFSEIYRKYKTVELPYCVDGITTEWMPYSGIADHQVVMFCYPMPPPFNRALAWSYTVISLISTVFLLLILIVYVALWDRQNTQGLIVFSYTASMLGSYFFSSIAQFSSLFPGIGFNPTKKGKTDGTEWPCLSIAILMHFFYLANYLWLTVMNFDLWMTFKSMKPRTGRKSQRFTFYSVTAWGSALALVAAFVAMDKIFSDPLSGVPVPDYAKSVCFVSMAFRGQYVYSPMGIIVAVNLLLIGLTMKIFCDARQTQSGQLSENRYAYESRKESGGSTKARRYSPELFIKLFLMMGGTSIVDFVTWYYNTDITPWYVATLECLSYLLPVALFKVFCINLRVLGQLEEKYPKMKSYWGVLKRFT